MKATINGITYEGTEEEIMRVVDRMTPKMEVKPFKTIETDWMKHLPEIVSDGRDGCIPLQPRVTSGGYTCRNEQCYCTGACQGYKCTTGVFMNSRTITI